MSVYGAFTVAQPCTSIFHRSTGGGLSTALEAGTAYILILGSRKVRNGEVTQDPWGHTAGKRRAGLLDRSGYLYRRNTGRRCSQVLRGL